MPKPISARQFRRDERRYMRDLAYASLDAAARDIERLRTSPSRAY